MTAAVNLLGDVGGTNCRLALETIATPHTIVSQRVYSTEDFPSPREAIAAFLKQAGDAKPTRAALALAAPITGDSLLMTNNDWLFERDVLMKAFALDQIVFLNDLAAQARAVFSLGATDFMPIGVSAAPPFTERMSVIGAGTGLGIACIDPGGPNPIITTEGGHAGFAPSDDLEMNLLRVLRREFSVVTNEHVASGPGLVRLYSVLGEIRGGAVEPIEGPEIMRRALGGADPLCCDTAKSFARILGAVAADAVLLQGAAGAVLVGAIANALAPILQTGGFRDRFDHRGPRRNHLAHAPALVATAADLGLKGASATLHDGEHAA